MRGRELEEEDTETEEDLATEEGVSLDFQTLRQLLWVYNYVSGGGEVCVCVCVCVCACV